MAAVQHISDGIPPIDTVIAAMTFILRWIIIVQIIVLVVGWRWFKPTARGVKARSHFTLRHA